MEQQEQYWGQPQQQAQQTQQSQPQQQLNQQPVQQQQPTYNQPANSRALAMVTYWSGLIGLIIALVVCDRRDPFVRHHLNQATLIMIAYAICGVLSFILIGGVLAIVVFVFQIMATVEAYHGTMNPIPGTANMKIIK